MQTFRSAASSVAVSIQRLSYRECETPDCLSIFNFILIYPHYPCFFSSCQHCPDKKKKRKEKLREREGVSTETLASITVARAARARGGSPPSRARWSLSYTRSSFRLASKGPAMLTSLVSSSLQFILPCKTSPGARN